MASMFMMTISESFAQFSQAKLVGIFFELVLEVEFIFLTRKFSFSSALVFKYPHYLFFVDIYHDFTSSPENFLVQRNKLILSLEFSSF